MNANASPEKPRMPIRWWPVVILGVLCFATIIWIWFVQDAHRQTRYIQTGILILVTELFLLVWLLLGSRLAWRTRFCTAAIWITINVALVGMFEIRGVTGDLLPVLAFRWSVPAVPPAVTLQASAVENPRLPAQTDTDFCQFLGPKRDGHLVPRPLRTDWQKDPPAELWRIPVGPAWSGFSAVGNYAITMEQRGTAELVTCYELQRGELISSHQDEARYFKTISGEGPRTVPTIAESRVFTLGATGILNCFDLATGQRLWTRDIVHDSASRIPEWGFSGSPLVMEGKVIVSAGGREGKSLAAYDATNGAPVWTGGDDRCQYSSPVLATFDDVPQVLIFNRQGVASHDLDDGTVLWSHDWPTGHPHVAMPVICPDDRVLISSGYGTGSELIRVTRAESGAWRADRLWKSNRLKSKFANLIVLGQDIYGLDDGILACLSLKNGARRWKKGRYGHGQLLAIGNLLLVMCENGDVVLVQADPERLQEVARFTALRGKTWNPHALTQHYLLVRNDHEAACFDLGFDPAP